MELFMDDGRDRHCTLLKCIRCDIYDQSGCQISCRQSVINIKQQRIIISLSLSSSSSLASWFSLLLVSCTLFGYLEKSCASISCDFSLISCKFFAGINMLYEKYVQDPLGRGSSEIRICQTNVMCLTCTCVRNIYVIVHLLRTIWQV